MLTIEQLKTYIQKKQNQNISCIFNADSYIINIKFSSNIYIYTSIENLNNYNKLDKIARLKYYVQQNTNVIGSMYSTLAYNKDNDVIIHQWLDKKTSLENILHAIDNLLIHADILTTKHY